LVAIGILQDNCSLGYAFDSLANTSAIPPASAGSVTLSDCDVNSSSFNFRVGRASTEMAIMAAYNVSFTEHRLRIIRIPMGGNLTSTVFDQNILAPHAIAPRMAIMPSGELLAIWDTYDWGIQGSHRSAGGAQGPAFEVEPSAPLFGASRVEGVYPRGDGRFALIYLGENGFIHFRDFHSGVGLTPRTAFPHEPLGPPNWPFFVSSTNGISAAWSYSADLSTDIFTAMQRVAR
jgi:hypothetical protein